jgi:hypothetical protein
MWLKRYLAVFKNAAEDLVDTAVNVAIREKPAQPDRLVQLATPVLPVQEPRELLV